MIFRNFLVRIYSAGENPQEFEINSNPMFIGRSMECHISFSGHGVSRRHLKVEYSEGKIYITDLDSRNGTFVDDALIGSDVYEYKKGEKIALGNSTEEIVISVEQGIPKFKKNSNKKRQSQTGVHPSQIQQELSNQNPGNRVGTEFDQVGFNPNNLEIVKNDRVKDQFSEIKKHKTEQPVDSEKVKEKHQKEIRKYKKSLELIKEELSIIQEELRNAKAKMNQKLKVIELEFENKRLTLESEFQKDKNQKERDLLDLEKEITIKKSQLDIINHKITNKKSQNNSSEHHPPELFHGVEDDEAS